MNAPVTTRAGFAAVVGRPNVGKSTLINALVGAKISIVTPKPQTTRHRILAVLTRPDCQIVFVDTPGLHRGADRAMNRLMNRTAAAALAGADVVVFVTEASEWTPEDGDVLDHLRRYDGPVLALINKVDKIRPKERLLESIAALRDRYDFDEIIPVSATKGDNLDVLVDAIESTLPESPPLFPADVRTDRSDEFRAAEVIREKLTILLREELPYGISVQIERFERNAGRIRIHAIIWVARDSHKGIVVGKGGRLLKQAGQHARLDLAAQFGQPVHVELWVKVKENWADSESDLMRLGYETP